MRFRFQLSFELLQFVHVCKRLERIGERLQISQNVRSLPRRPPPRRQPRSCDRYQMVHARCFYYCLLRRKISTCTRFTYGSTGIRSTRTCVFGEEEAISKCLYGLAVYAVKESTTQSYKQCEVASVPRGWQV